MAKWIEDPQGRLEVEKVTEEIKLPVWKANYKGKFREFWNECWEKIEDSFLKIKKSNEGKEPAITTKETAFNKPFGVSEDTVLEGNKFTQMTGKDYGGILNIAGQKEAGKAYWDNNTKKLYICKNNNSDISPNVNNYIPFDNGSILERLENLITNDSYSFKIGNLIIQGGYGITRTGYIYFSTPFPTICISVVPAASGSGITEINDDTLVIDDSLSNEERKVKFRVLAKNKTTQIRVNYIAIGY